MLTFDEMLTLASESLSLVFRGVEFATAAAAGVFFGPTSPRLGRVDLAAALGFSQGFFFGTASSAGGAFAAGTPHLGVAAGAGAGSGRILFFLCQLLAPVAVLPSRCRCPVPAPEISRKHTTATT